ncbi:MAG: glycosyltransferase [Nitrospirae bacterium]|nr:glycosyltransferase [Nitrospirota bacterium]
MPKVSVIIPNYNHARYLDQRMVSVLGQTYRDFEVIFLDDASTDNSREVFGKYQGDSRIRAVFNEKNSGSPFVQWNSGVKMAKGEYVWIAESDDYADSRLLETLVGALDRNPSVGIAYCASMQVDQHGSEFGVWLPTDIGGYRLDENRWRTDFTNDGKDECSNFMIVRCTIPNASAVVFRKSVYEMTGYADETMRLCGDWLMWCKMLMISGISYTARPLNCFRTHRHSVRSTIEGEAAKIAEMYRVIRFISGGIDVSPEIMRRVNADMAGLWAAFMLSKHGRKNWRRNSIIYAEAARGVGFAGLLPFVIGAIARRIAGSAGI